MYGQETGLTRQWAKAKVRRLESDDIEALLAVIFDLCEIHYVAKRAFRDNQLCESSDMEEDDCKIAIGARLKRGGMYWTLQR